MIVPRVHGPHTIVLHTLLLHVGKKLCTRGGYFELFRRKNFGYYDLLKSGTIADKLFTNALDVMTLVGLYDLRLVFGSVTASFISKGSIVRRQRVCAHWENDGVV